MYSAPKSGTSNKITFIHMLIAIKRRALSVVSMIHSAFPEETALTGWQIPEEMV